jgi:hypothetical protein
MAEELKLTAHELEGWMTVGADPELSTRTARVVVYVYHYTCFKKVEKDAVHSESCSYG